MEKKKTKILRYVLVVIIVLVVLFLGKMIKNCMIINRMWNLSKNYVNSTNYEVDLSINDIQNKTSSHSHMYYKNGIIVMNIESPNYENKTIYIKGDERFEINENNEKYVYPDDAMVSWISPMPIRVNSDWFYQLKFYATAKIESDNYNGKDCYWIKDIGMTWVDKETGLIVKDIPDGGYMTLDYTYTFDTVTDEDVAIPIVSE